MTTVSAKTASAQEATHVSLQLGRLLLVNGADTTHAEISVDRLAASLGYEAHLLVSYEALLLTVISDGKFRTKVGPRVEGMTVDMTGMRALDRIVDEAALGQLDAATLGRRLDELEHVRPSYPGWLVACALGLTTASLSRLFGGDGSVFITAFIAGTLVMLVQQQLRKRHVHPLAVTFISALVGGSVGGLGMHIHPGATPALCLIAPGMILVPGVPLINGISDALNNNISLGLARLASALLVVMAIALGLFAATVLTGVEIPTSGATPLLPIGQDAIFSALATIGYVLLFNVMSRVAFGCIICGLCSHALRTALMHLGLDIATGTIIGSMAAGFLADACAHGFAAPTTTFAFPGVVAMVPGSYAFRAVVASLQVMHLAGASPASLVAQTLSLVFSTVLLTGAIAIGLGIPLSLRLSSGRSSGQRQRQP